MTSEAPFKRLKYVGEALPHLTGHWVEVPANIPLSQATSWIELNHSVRAQEADVEAPSDEDAEWQNPAAAEESGPSELDLLRESVANLNARLEQPDASRAADAIASTARAMQSSWDISRDLQKLEEQARAATEKNQFLADSAETFFRETEQERKKITGVTKANQQLMNQAFTSYSNQIKELRKEKTELEYELGELRSEVKDGRKDLAKLRKILADWESKTNG